MKDKVVVITGANSGIGKAAALRFATEGYHVVMACRNMEISEAVQRQIKTESNNPHVDLMKIDVSSFESIRAFYSAYINKYPHLDILIHNAAYLNHGEKEYKLSPEHIEISFATNAFGPMLMTQLLADHLERSLDPRVLAACTTNIKNFFDPKRKIDFDNLRGEYQGTRRYSSYKMYGDSKMALLLLTFKMAEQFKSRGIKVNALQINRIRLSKETMRKLSPLWKGLAWLQNLTNPSPAGMAENYYHICTSDEFSQETGCLINHKREIVQPSISEKGFEQLKNIFGSSTYPQYATDRQTIEKIWSMGEELIRRNN
ncbi:SDR family NAD(P)-dependent oxidoreductase [Gorillibacterium massiliense]|uniref:SDR family NAD(P)-dependent oxidoreductase n=1 Tax=Gorillibacterium massiliense TaxID=1280390 RepID=UPI0004BCF58A|nr:SDR family NAD(P)-dependent oxidoreductase [Gorillibacterium massiliense]